MEISVGRKADRFIIPGPLISISPKNLKSTVEKILCGYNHFQEMTGNEVSLCFTPSFPISSRS